MKPVNGGAVVLQNGATLLLTFEKARWCGATIRPSGRRCRSVPSDAEPATLLAARWKEHRSPNNRRRP